MTTEINALIYGIGISFYEIASSRLAGISTLKGLNPYLIRSYYNAMGWGKTSQVEQLVSIGQD
jgi:hypothetical protein